MFSQVVSNFGWQLPHQIEAWLKANPAPPPSDPVPPLENQEAAEDPKDNAHPPEIGLETGAQGSDRMEVDQEDAVSLPLDLASALELQGPPEICYRFEPPKSTQRYSSARKNGYYTGLVEEYDSQDPYELSESMEVDEEWESPSDPEPSDPLAAPTVQEQEPTQDPKPAQDPKPDEPLAEAGHGAKGEDRMEVDQEESPAPESLPQPQSASSLKRRREDENPKTSLKRPHVDPKTSNKRAREDPKDQEENDERPWKRCRCDFVISALRGVGAKLKGFAQAAKDLASHVTQRVFKRKREELACDELHLNKKLLRTDYPVIASVRLQVPSHLPRSRIVQARLVAGEPTAPSSISSISSISSQSSSTPTSSSNTSKSEVSSDSTPSATPSTVLGEDKLHYVLRVVDHSQQSTPLPVSEILVVREPLLEVHCEAQNHQELRFAMQLRFLQPPRKMFRADSGSEPEVSLVLDMWLVLADSTTMRVTTQPLPLTFNKNLLK